MLEYEWGNPSAIMMAGEEPDQAAHHHHHHHHGSDATVRPDMLAHYASTHDQPSFNDHNHHFLTNPHHNHHHDNHDLSSNNNSSTFAHHHFNLPPTHHSHTHTHTQSQPPSLGHHHHHHPHLYDPRAYGGASAYAPQTPQSILSLEGPQFMLVPKSEDQAHAVAGVCRTTAVDLIGSARIGLNLGGRTYFSSSEDDFMSRLYRRPRPLDVGAAANSPRCQAEGCNADLSHAKHYHRRHKVCEFHSKASTVIAAGLTQRFCQQCSRFHLLSEFDNGKRSCRKRLADHNRRRRKTQQQPNLENPKSSSSLPENSRASIPTSDQNISRSPPDSGAQSSSSVTVAVSPPRMSLDCFRQRSSYQGTTSSGSSSSLFFSSG